MATSQERSFNEISAADATNPDAGVRWIRVLSNSANDLPAGCLLHVNGQDVDGNLTVAEPTADNQVGLLVNGTVPLLAGAYGQAHQVFPAAVLFELGEGTPAAGDEWGVQSGDVKLHKVKTGYTFANAPAAATEYGTVQPTTLVKSGGGATTYTVQGAQGTDLNYATPVTPASILVDSTFGLRFANLAGSLYELNMYQASTTITGSITTFTGQTLVSKVFKNSTAIAAINGATGQDIPYNVLATVADSSYAAVFLLNMTTSGTTGAGGISMPTNAVVQMGTINGSTGVAPEVPAFTSYVKCDNAGGVGGGNGAVTLGVQGAGGIVGLAALSDNTGVVQFELKATGSPGDVLFAVSGLAGKTGTTGGGDTVTGGIITALGTGPATISGGTW